MREWKAERDRYEAAWARYQNVAERIDAEYENLESSGIEDQEPSDEELSELQEAWKELEEARERLGEYINEFHERRMAQGKSNPA